MTQFDSAVNKIGVMKNGDYLPNETERGALDLEKPKSFQSEPVRTTPVPLLIFQTYNLQVISNRKAALRRDAYQSGSTRCFGELKLRVLLLRGF